MNDAVIVGDCVISVPTILRVVDFTTHPSTYIQQLTMYPAVT